uniref:Uncharacterized protein n=1 Tax=Cyanoderma ruficeps TaxID=181631 RepID=A0A8C3NV89_9PASS
SCWGSLSFPLSGLRSSADLWADSVGAGSVWCVRVGSAALWAHGPGSQPLHHRAVCIQGSCFLLIKMGCWPGQAGEEDPLLRISFCLAGTAPIRWCLHCLCHPQLLPHSLGITGFDHGTVVLGQQLLQCPLDPHSLCR